MSASHEPSYYEIALTNRQVLTVFVVLLVCVVAAFFSGVWIGRRGGVETARAEVAQAEQPAVAEEATLKELRFFSDEPQQPGHRPLQESTQNPDRGSAPLEEPTREAVSGDETESRPVRRQASGPAPVDKAVESTSPPLPVVAETAPSQVKRDNDGPGGRAGGPSNDDCADALPIDDGVTPFSTIGATTDGLSHSLCDADDDDQVGADIWYDYTATCSEMVTVSKVSSIVVSLTAAFSVAWTAADDPVVTLEMLSVMPSLGSGMFVHRLANGRPARASSAASSTRY